MLAFPRFNPIDCAAAPVYVPENVSVPSVAVRFASVPPREIPEIVELVSPALSRVPEIVGVRVNAPAVGTTLTPRVCPLVVCVVVENVIAVAVVVPYPEPSAVRYVPAA